MAWIHPTPIGGDYRIIGVSNSTTNAAEALMTPYDTIIQSDVAAETDLNNVTNSSDWKCVGSSGDDVALHIGVTNDPIYNPNGELFYLDGTTLFDPYPAGPSNPVGFQLNKTPVSVQVWTGAYEGIAASNSAGEGYEFGDYTDPGVCTGYSHFPDSDWSGAQSNALNYTNLRHLYGISPLISTVSGSISGTINRTQTDIWAVGTITLTGDIDFGGDVNLKAALDPSQTPTITGDYFIDVGSGGSIVDLGLPIKIKDSGTNNNTSGNIGSGIKVR